MIDESEALARLWRQAEDAAASGEAGILTLRAVVEEASELGARRALARLGLADAAARDDMVELRELLAAWRDAKRSAWRATVDWLVRGALALLLIGLAVRFGVHGGLR